MIQNLSNSIMVPIAGVILAIVMTLELIQMITDRNNLHDVDTWMIFKWVFKSAAAILLVTNTWNLVMAVFDMAQSVVAQASGIIGSDASIDISAVMTDMESRLMDMDLGPLFGLWFQSLFIGITMWALYICIFIVIYGPHDRNLPCHVGGPHPDGDHDGQGMGRHGPELPAQPAGSGLPGIFDYRLRGDLRRTVQNIATEEDIIMAIWSCVGYTVLLCFTLFKDRQPVQSRIQRTLDPEGGNLPMAYVPVPKDLTKVKTKVAFNLTKRQLVCFGCGALIGVPLFFLLRGPAGNSVAAMCMMLVMLPFFMLAMYEKHGQPLEKIIGNILKVAVIRPKQRPYRTNTSMPCWSGRQISTRRCMTLFAAKTKRQAEPAEPQTKPRRKLTRAERKQIEAAIARANRTGKRNSPPRTASPMSGCGRTASARWRMAATPRPSSSRTSTTS